MDLNAIILENVMQHDCLFNLGSKEYKNIHKKTEIWEGNGKSINLSGEACRKRWRTLRDTYKRRKRASQLASGSGAPSPSKKWKYFETMQFLDGYKDARPTIGSVDDSCSEIEYLLDCSSSTILNNDGSDESAAPTKTAIPKKYTKRHADAEATSVFTEVMHECAKSIKEIASQKETLETSTSLLFDSLARKIQEESGAYIKVNPKRVSSSIGFLFENLCSRGFSMFKRALNFSTVILVALKKCSSSFSFNAAKPIFWKPSSLLLRFTGLAVPTIFSVNAYA